MTQEATNSLGPRLPWAGKLVHLEQVEEEDNPFPHLNYRVFADA